MFWIMERGLLEHGDRLRALPVAAQRLRIVDRNVGIAGLGTVALAPRFHGTPPIGVGARRGGHAERSRRLGRLDGLATHERDREHRRDKAARAGGRFGTYR